MLEIHIHNAEPNKTLVLNKLIDLTVTTVASAIKLYFFKIDKMIFVTKRSKANNNCFKNAALISIIG